jgi:peptidoglycan/xylan/chitin deacetylase (PgdA/CDA1 family)
MKATFFMVAEQLPGRGALAREIRDAGHGIGLHGMRHEAPWKFGRRRFERDVTEARACFEREALPVRLYRPPYGRMRPSQLRVLRDAGLELVLWSLMPMEFNHPPSDSASFLSSRLGGGDIVVLHDRPECLAATLELVEILHTQVVRNSLKTVPLPYDS